LGTIDRITVMREKTVTCGFTLYNCEDTICEALLSAIQQTYPYKEIIVHDDASVDSSVKKTRDLLESHNIPYILLLSRENVGVAQARNLIIKECKTEYLAFFDDDDISKEERLEIQIKEITAYENKYPKGKSPLCYSNRLVMKKGKRPFRARAIYIDAEDRASDLYYLALLSANNLPFCAIPGSTATCTMLARTCTLRGIGAFDKRLRRYEDLAFAIIALKKGYSLISSKADLVTQMYTFSKDKIDQYLYNRRLVYYYRDLYPSKNIYKYALRYVIAKHNLLRGYRMKGIQQLIILIEIAPIRTFYLIVGALRTLKYSYDQASNCYGRKDEL